MESLTALHFLYLYYSTIVKLIGIVMADEKIKKKRKKKRKKPDKRYCRFGRCRDRSAVIARIFDENANDLSYITNNEELLKLHFQFISECPYSVNSALKKLTVPAGASKGLHPKIFDNFEKRYPYIHERWVHMIKSCLDPTYPSYKYFGAKGIYVSRDFLDSRWFCRWCLRNGLTSKLGSYDKYLLRKKKNGNYSPVNCYVMSEKELHECKSVRHVLDSLYIVKRYEERHHPSVSYMTMYSRYYVWDWSLDDALMIEYDTRIPTDQFGFSPVNFYKSVADDKSCSQSTFLSRVHYSYLNGGFICRPYDMLKPEYSVNAECAKQGRLSYKQQWDRNRKEQESKYNPYNSADKFEPIVDSNNISTDVYSYNKDFDVYGE